jgi:hypothetical protein
MVKKASKFTSLIKDCPVATVRNETGAFQVMFFDSVKETVEQY